MLQITPHPYHRQSLASQLGGWMPDLPPAALDALHEAFDWFELAGGETLMRQGEPGDALFVLASGRLRTHVRDGEAEGAGRVVRDIARGEFIGEMSLLTGEPRSATLVAVRDSVVARLPRERFDALLVASPQMSMTLARQVVHRLRSENRRTGSTAPVTMGLVPVSAGVDVAALAAALAAEMRKAGSVALVDEALLHERLGVGAAAQVDSETGQRIAQWLDELEAGHDFLLLVGGEQADAWTRCVCWQSDELLLLADAAQPPVLHPTETAWLAASPQRTDAAQVLVLLHAADVRSPRGSARWLARRPLAGHVHVRPARPADIARLARLQTRTAVGLVLAGGGARGFAQLGVLRALRERGIEVDCVGGTSIGAVMAASIAFDRPYDETVTVLRRAFSLNPTGDFNLLPLLSLIRGRRLRRIVDHAIGELAGGPVDAEDLWKNFFAVATNYSAAQEQVLADGPLGPLLRASIAIPGALPPVLRDGALLCDGGTLNNFPTDVMRGQRGIGRVIGVDLNLRQDRRYDFDEMPGTWALLADRLRPKRHRRFRLPSLAAYLLNVTVLYSASRQRSAHALADLCFNPPLQRVGLLDWRRFDEIVERGYRHALEVLAGAATAPAEPGRGAQAAPAEEPPFWLPGNQTQPQND